MAKLDNVGRRVHVRQTTGTSRGVAVAAVVASVATLAGAPAAARAQGDAGVPVVLFRFESEYAAVTGAGAEQGRDPRDDVRWAQDRARPLTEFHDDQGTGLLRRMSDYAGVAWPYAEIPVYLLRRFPTLSIQYPFTVAVGEIQRGQGRQELPDEGDFLILVWAHQIAHYLLDPPPPELGASRPRELDHPLVEEGNWRREALVNLVTYRALEDLWGEERLRRARSEPVWISYNPEEAFVDTLRTRWSLSRTTPLKTWLAREGTSGPVLELAEKLERQGGAAPPAAAGAPGRVTPSGTDVGLDLGVTADGRLVIAFLDRGSPAEAAGLRGGDVVLTIEGRRFTSAAQAMAEVERAWEGDREVNVSVERQGREVFFQIH
jgi:hypothetical protein